VTCTYCGVEFTDGDATVEILGELVHRECDLTAQAMEAIEREVAV
jgi:hypothetical protein